MAELEKKHRELADAVRNCIETVKRKGAKNVSDDFMAEAERLATEKREVELQKPNSTLTSITGKAWWPTSR